MSLVNDVRLVVAGLESAIDALPPEEAVTLAGANRLPRHRLLPGDGRRWRDRGGLILWIADHKRLDYHTSDDTHYWHCGTEYKGQQIPLSRCLFNGAQDGLRRIRGGRQEDRTRRRAVPSEDFMTNEESSLLQPGQRVQHAEFGEGVVVEQPNNGFARVFFGGGERQVPVTALTLAVSRSEQIVRNAAAGERRAKRAWLSYKAHALPLLESAAALTSAKIDLLPHQVVLTHRIATASPRRFLIADEVGLGKTIETALILRELASRGELNRALMVVPAGLVNNWHRELNEVFNLNFEVFGSEGDVTDRKSNAFAKHDRLIASIDTLKMRPRMKRLQEAPPWDLVVFDEAHHLTAYRRGTKVEKTENYRLAEVLKEHCRDLLLLSATPHQGDHFRFWMLIQLLEPHAVQKPRRHGGEPPPTELGHLPPHQGRRLPTGRLDAVRPPLGSYRIVRHVGGRAGVLQRPPGLLDGRLRPGKTAGQQGPGTRLRDDDLPEDRRLQLRRRPPHAAPPPHRPGGAGRAAARRQPGHRRP